MKAISTVLLFGALCAVSGCRRDQGAALQLQVTVEPDAQARCLRVAAINAATGVEVPSPAVIAWRAGTSEYRVALFRNASTGDRVRVRGTAHAAEDCTGEPLQVGEAEGDFPSSGSAVLTVALHGRVVTDGGEDGGQPDGGEPDGGEPDGGAPDGGTDGGQVDGGTDAGQVDAGPGCLPSACAPRDCHIAACDSNGECVYTDLQARGASCDGGAGRCSAAAACVPWFTYAPGNFDPSAGPAVTDVTLDCAAVVDASANASQRFVNWCGQPLPAEEAVALDGGQSALLLSLGNFTIADAGSLQLVGNRPVILAVYGAASIRGWLDMNPDEITPGSCGASRGFNGATDSHGGGGGGGGSLGSLGGNGGIGGDGAVAGPRGDLWGSSPTLTQQLVGGCSGGTGGGGGPVGGAGGGAIQIAAAETLSLTGRISASGAGGLGGRTTRNGASGGGSGGGILLEGNPLTLSGAKVTANGGGGGEGHGLTLGLLPCSGADGTRGELASGTQTLGGDAPLCNALVGGKGGASSGAATQGGDGPTTAQDKGGGGGGGGMGIIELRSTATCTLDPGSLFSPAPNAHSTCVP